MSFETLPGPRGLPLLGMALSLDPERVHAQVESWCEQHGELIRFRLGPQRFLAVAKPQLIRQLLLDRPGAVRRISRFESIARELGLHGVFSAEGDDWKRQRSLVTPAFSSRNLDRLIPQIGTLTERLADRLQTQAASANGQGVDVLHALMRYSVDVTCAVVFGKRASELESEQDALSRNLNFIFESLNRRVNAPMPYWRFVKLAPDRAVDRTLVEVGVELDGLIRAARARLDAGAEPETLLDALILARDEEGAALPLTDAELRANVMTLLLAGEDTTANSIAWILYYLAAHPEMQARVLDEARSVLGERALVQQLGQTRALRYLGAVTHEALRLRSPAPMLFMEAATPLQLDGIEVPAGTALMLMTRRASTRDAAFADALRFAPERWLDDERAQGTVHDERQSLPFGAGPRICPGRSLALLECAMATSLIVQRFEVRAACDLSRVEERFDFAMEPAGLRLDFVARAPRNTAFEPGM